MNAISALKELERYPVFDIRKVQNVIDKGPEYARLFVHRLKKRGLLKSVERNKYTLHENPLVVAAYVVWPSYLSCQTALRYHNLTEQVLHDVIVITTKPKKSFYLNNTRIRFIKTKPKNFFGFEREREGEGVVSVADAEKALLDAALYRQLSLAEVKDVMKEHAKELNLKKMVAYLLRVGNGSLARRIGYLLNRLGYDYYSKLKKYVNHNYVKLDYAAPTTGRKDKKWMLIINIKV